MADPDPATAPLTGAVLVLNAGSSSLKVAVVDPSTGERSLSALGERLGTPEARLQRDGTTRDLPGAGHEEALTAVMADVDLAGLVGVGHRVVHGGERFSASVLVDDDVLAAVEEVSPLAPLHNPPGLATIAAARALLPDLPHVAVFDTAFHATVPPAAHRYAVPQEWYERYGVRRYGFHGTSARYVSARAASCSVVHPRTPGSSSPTSATAAAPRRSGTASPSTPPWGSRRSRAWSWAPAPATSTRACSPTSAGWPAWTPSRSPTR